MAKLIIDFDNQRALEHFASWLCGSGEQQYWEWMANREGEEDGDITAVSFNYHDQEGDFIGGNTIRTDCGRLTKDD
jgi:hypothetical protein